MLLALTKTVLLVSEIVKCTESSCETFFLFCLAAKMIHSGTCPSMLPSPDIRVLVCYRDTVGLVLEGLLGGNFHLQSLKDKNVKLNFRHVALAVHEFLTRPTILQEADDRAAARMAIVKSVWTDILVEGATTIIVRVFFFCTCALLSPEWKGCSVCSVALVDYHHVWIWTTGRIDWRRYKRHAICVGESGLPDVPAEER